MYEIFSQMPPKEQRTTGFFSATFAEELQGIAADFMQAEDTATRYGYVFARIAPVKIVPRGIKQVSSPTPVPSGSHSSPESTSCPRCHFHLHTHFHCRRQPHH